MGNDLEWAGCVVPRGFVLEAGMGEVLGSPQLLWEKERLRRRWVFVMDSGSIY